MIDRDDLKREILKFYATGEDMGALRAHLETLHGAGFISRLNLNLIVRELVSDGFLFQRGGTRSVYRTQRKGQEWLESVQAA